MITHACTKNSTTTCFYTLVTGVVKVYMYLGSSYVLYIFVLEDELIQLYYDVCPNGSYITGS